MATAEVDLLFASCGIEEEIVMQAVERELHGVGVVRVARVGHLIAMKLLSVRDERANDRADLIGLMSVASRAELDEARRAVILIQERGFHRGRTLSADLEHLVHAHRLRRSHDQGR